MSAFDLERRRGNERRSGGERRTRPLGENNGIHGESGSVVAERRASKRTVRDKPDFAKIWIRKGDEFLRIRQYIEAKEAFHQALNIRPTLATAYYGLAGVSLAEGQKTEGLDHLRKAIIIAPGCKQRAKKDTNFKVLWKNEDFEQITT